MTLSRCGKISLSIGFSFFSLSGFANEPSSPMYEVEGSFPVVIQTQKSTKINLGESSAFTAENLTGTKTIQLMKVKPSAKQIEKTNLALSEYSGEYDYSYGIIPFSQSPGAVELGMANVPVLDQGPFGTCVTFAATAAIDAVLKVGDFVDQQCTLELNVALGNNYWNGAWSAVDVLAPLKRYGLVKKNTCNARYPNPNARISLSGYRSKVSRTVSPNAVNYIKHDGISLDTVKAAIRAGHRVAVGFLLKATSTQGFDININGYPRKGGLWACQQAFVSWNNYCGQSETGHEVIITGFDDNQQLLKIRNSWSEMVADDGEFYMTYAFFAAMVMEGTEIY